VLANAPQAGASATVDLPPGTHSVREEPAGATRPGDYRSTVECRRNARHRGRQRSGTSYEGLELAAGDVASCTFRNVRIGAPAIAIRKTGPGEALKGDRLRTASS
jgi:hypothetical protein